MDKVKDKSMREKLKEQIIFIRDTGLTNMYDKNQVQRLAYQNEFYELVCFIEEHTKEYGEFISTGNEALLDTYSSP